MNKPLTQSELLEAIAVSPTRYVVVPKLFGYDFAPEESLDAPTALPRTPERANETLLLFQLMALSAVTLAIIVAVIRTAAWLAS